MFLPDSRNNLIVNNKQLVYHYVSFELLHEKTNNLGLRPCPTQTGLYSHRRRLEARNFVFGKKRDCTIRVVKTKALISCAVTAQLICAFVLAYAHCWFSDVAAHLILSFTKIVGQ